MDELRILLVDDEEGIRKTHPQDLEDKLSDCGISSTVDAVGSLDDASERLAEHDYMLCLVDMKLGGTEDGNQIILEILDTRLVPIIVYSGFPDDLDKEFDRHGLIQVAKEKKTDSAVAQIKEWSDDAVFELFTREGLVDSRLHDALMETMWQNVSPYWEDLPTEDSKALTEIATRIVSTILLDELRTRQDGSGEKPIHHGEVYIFSTPRKFLSAGDVIEVDDSHWMTLTPACDLIPRDGSAKVPRVLCARCELMPELLESGDPIAKEVKKANKDPPTKSAQTNLARAMRHDFNNRAGDKFYLPPFGPFDGGVVRFLELQTFPYEDGQIENLANSRVVSLNPDLSSELATRFSRFMSRLGQPAYDRDPILSEFSNRFGEFGPDETQ